MNRSIFLDRDGVINIAPIVNGRPTSPHTLKEFRLFEGIAESLGTLKTAGFLLIVVTNQPDLAHGKITRESLDLLHEEMMNKLPLDDLFICPHDDRDNCHCRKPKPGMLLEAARKWNIDLTSSVIIGDRWREVDAGRAVGCKTILIDTVYNQETVADYRAKDVQQAVNIVLSLNKSA